MASTLPYISREDLNDIARELEHAKESGRSPDLDALECTVLLDLILAFRQGQIVGCPPPGSGDPLIFVANGGIDATTADGPAVLGGSEGGA